MATLVAVMREKALVSEESAFTHRICTFCESSGELSCGVAVVGLDAAGLTVALPAADGSSRVIAIDSPGNFEKTTNTHTTGAWMTEGEEHLKHDHYLTQQQTFE